MWGLAGPYVAPINGMDGLNRSIRPELENTMSTVTHNVPTPAETAIPPAGLFATALEILHDAFALRRALLKRWPGSEY